MIHHLKAYAIFNSRMGQTLLARVWTDSGVFSASVPTGTSKGKHEAWDLPPEKALEMSREISKTLKGLDEQDWQNFDIFLQQLDKTGNFSRIGGNLALAASLAVARAATGGELWRLTGKERSAQFPMPVANMIGGGKHDGGTDWQEFLVIPHNAESPAAAFLILREVWKDVGDRLKEKGVLLGRNRENAWMAKLDETRTLDLLSKVAEEFDVRLGVDFAASSFWNGRKYVYKKRRISPEKQMKAVIRATNLYKLSYLEDPFEEADFEFFAVLNSRLKKSALIIGDDLYCTNQDRLERGIKIGASDGIIIKPNQIGTLYQTAQTVGLAKRAGQVIVPSHRSVETEDAWLADLAVAFDAPLMKIGLGDIPKFNRLAQLWADIPSVQMAAFPL
ncbi:MAG: enolase [Candidatus Aenigmatarchaeota archaeon]